MERIENRMTVNSEWEFNAPADVKEKMKNSGYTEIGKGTFVADEDAFDYALERITGGTEEEKREFTEWFYSGNWVRT